MRGKIQIEYDREKLEKFRSIALKNGKPRKLQSLFDMVVDIATDCVDYLSDNDFEQLLKLKK